MGGKGRQNCGVARLDGTKHTSFKPTPRKDTHQDIHVYVRLAYGCNVLNNSINISQMVHGSSYSIVSDCAFCVGGRYVGIVRYI